MDFFKFEDEGVDFPFYNENPKLSLLGGFLLILSIFLGFIAYYLNIPFISSFLFAFIMFVPLLYLLKWDFNALFRKPSLKDIALAILVVFAYIIYSTVAGYLFQFIGFDGFASPPLAINICYEFISLLFSMLGEELVKIILFLIFLTLIFKFSNNRKLSIIFSMFFTLIIFGLLHAVSGSVIVAVVIQGFGSIFHMLLYLKTKNVVVSYISHFLTDFSVIFLGYLGSF